MYWSQLIFHSQITLHVVVLIVELGMDISFIHLVIIMILCSVVDYLECTVHVLLIDQGKLEKLNFITVKPGQLKHLTFLLVQYRYTNHNLSKII